MGAWMQSVAQSWLVLELTDSTFYVGLVIALQFTPILLFGLVGGVLADRFDKRKILLVTQSLAALQALVLASLTLSGVVEGWHVMALAGTLGLVNSMDMPTRQSFVSELVGKKDVMNAVALNTSAFNLARIVGPAIAGLLIARFGVGIAFLINGVSFVGVLAALAAMRPQELFRAEGKSRDGLREGLVSGLRYVRETPVVQIPIVLVGVVATFGMNFNVLLPGMSRDMFDIGSEGFGLLMSAMGFGSLLSALLIAFLGKIDPVPTMVRGSLAFSVLVTVFALSPSFPWIGLVVLNLMLVGFATISMTATANTSIQRAAPDHLRGRVMSVYVSIFAGTMPIGSLFAGGVAARYGPEAALWGGGLICLVTGIWAWLRARRLSETELDQTRA